MATRNKHAKKPSSRRSQRKWLGVFLVIVLAVVAAAASFFVTKLISEHSKSGPSQTSGQVASTQAAGDQSKSGANASSEDQSIAKRVEDNPQTPAQYEGENPNNLDTLTGVISSTGESNGSANINIAIDQAINGTCTFTLRNPNGVVYTDTSTTESGPTSAFCSYAGTAPAVSGHWEISVKISSDDNRTGTITGTMEL